MADSKFKTKVKAEAGVQVTTETASRALQLDASGNVQSSAVTTTELGYVSGVTSSLQTQLGTNATAISDHISDATDAHDASAISSVASGNLAATDVQSALNELQSDIDTRATVTYVDSAIQGLKPKTAVRVATLVAGTLATSFENGDTIDGIVLATGNRILIKNQASALENGIYVVQATGAPIRATDFDSVSPIDEINGAYTMVQEGTQSGQGWVQQGTVTTIDTDAINFVIFNNQSSLVITASQVSDFSEASQDAVGTILVDSSSIDFTYTDATPSITAVVLPAGVDHDALLNFVANEHIDHSAVVLSGAANGGIASTIGDITASRSISIDITNATAETSADNADLLLIYDNSATALRKMSRANFLAGSLVSSPGDINETSFSAADNQAAAANVTGFAFANGVVRSFKAQVSVSLDATADLFEMFELQGIQKGASWDMSVSAVGDDSGIVFSITTAGQIQYTSLLSAGFVSNTIRFRALTLSV